MSIGSQARAPIRIGGSHGLATIPERLTCSNSGRGAVLLDEVALMGETTVLGHRSQATTAGAQ
jgi:hypothetical protein